MAKKDNKEVAKLLAIISDCDVKDDFQEIVDTYIQITNIQPEKKEYWEDLLNYIYFNYYYTDSYDWDDVLLQAITLSQNAREHIHSQVEQSLFYMFEYNFIVELIRFDIRFSEDYGGDKLEELLDLAEESDPENGLAIHEKANLYQANGDFERASEVYERAIKLDENIVCIHDMALNYQLMGENEKARQKYWRLYENTDTSSIKKLALEKIIALCEVDNNYAKKKYYEELLDDLQ